ncbi:MAG TPA: type II CAAX endopeptidase family protein [Rubrobacter sp.]|nr:type II CAAX endopeptidase family protein [Rubrobacter sp.]
MREAQAIVERHPLISFFVLAYGLTWPVIPLVSVSPLLGLPALFGPAIAAIIVSVVTQGKTGLKDLLGRLMRWRVGARWYAIALGLPAVLASTAAGVHLLLGGTAAIRFGGLSVLNFVVFVLVVGEELGWRGYALPRLLVGRSALAASLILGVLWAAWHLPTFFVPGAPQYGLPFLAFLLFTVAYSVLFSWVYVHTRGSVLIATLFHGAINLSQGFFLGGIEPAREYWLLTFVYGVAVLAVALMFGSKLSRNASSGSGESEDRRFSSTREPAEKQGRDQPI